MPFRFPGAQPFRFSAQRGVAQRMAPVYALLCIHRRIFYTVTRRRDSGAPPWRRYSRRRGARTASNWPLRMLPATNRPEGAAGGQGDVDAPGGPLADGTGGVGPGLAGQRAARRGGTASKPVLARPSIQANPTPSAFISRCGGRRLPLGCFMQGQPARAARCVRWPTRGEQGSLTCPPRSRACLCARQDAIQPFRRPSPRYRARCRSVVGCPFGGIQAFPLSRGRHGR